MCLREVQVDTTRTADPLSNHSPSLLKLMLCQAVRRTRPQPPYRHLCQPPIPVPASSVDCKLERSPGARLASGPQLEDGSSTRGWVKHADSQAHPSHQRVEARARRCAFNEQWVMLTATPGARLIQQNPWTDRGEN